MNTPDHTIPVKRLSEKYRYVILAGNNSQLVRTVMKNSHRSKYWDDYTNAVPIKDKINQAYKPMQRPISPMMVHFKWSPCSIKTDFYKLQALVPNQNDQFKFIRPRNMLNHFEFHREISRKDELIHNLRTQLHHDGENLFNYTPISLNIVIHEGKHQNLEGHFQKFLKMYKNLHDVKS